MSTPRELLQEWPDFERWEVFRDGTQRVGAMRRVWKYSVLLTRVVIEGDEGPYQAESRIRFIPGIDWDLSWFHATGMEEPVLLHNPASWTHTGSLPVIGSGNIPTRDGRELPSGRRRPVEAGTLPGYGEYLVLARMVASGRREAQWNAVDDETGLAQQTRLVAVDDAPPPARLPAGVEAMGPIQRFDRMVAGTVRASHWVADGVVLASEWNGIHSVAVLDQAGSAGWEAIAGLEPANADFLLQGMQR
ncbi:hypothetical protein [Arthrobacter sp.]|uniref:hypothetical protein n=1 Tax=Arthrobacter sp. TaxID=1667 RepID=UPI003A933C4B